MLKFLHISFLCDRQGDHHQTTNQLEGIMGILQLVKVW